MGSGEYNLFEDDSGNDVLNIQENKTSAYQLLEVVHADNIPGANQADIIFKVRGGSSSNQDLFTIAKAGVVTWSGGGSANANTAYTYSQVGHLPLAGGTVSGNLTVTGDFTVQGTTTTLDTATLNVEDKNITVNYATGDSSGSADGAGITIQDAVDASTDATILWDQSSSEFDFSHGATFAGPLEVTGNASYVGNYGYGTLVLQDTAGYPGIYFREGNINWLQRKSGADDDMEFVYSSDASAAGTGTFTPRFTIHYNGGIDVHGGTISSGAITSSGNIQQNYGNELRGKDSNDTERTLLRTNSDKLQIGWSYAGDVEFMGGGSYTKRMAISGSTGDVSIVNDLSVSGTISSGAITSSGTLTANGGGVNVNGGTGNSYVSIGSDTGNWVWKNYRADHKLALEDSDGTGEVLNFDTSGNATYAANVILGNQTDIDMDANSNGQLEIRGNGYTGAIALNDEYMNIYHNSSARGIVLGVNEAARVTVRSDGDVEFYHSQSVFGATRWYVSSSDLAHQRVDVRDESTASRAHWYGVLSDGSTSNFRHAWYTGSGYINVTADTTDGVTFDGSLKVNNILHVASRAHLEGGKIQTTSNSNSPSGGDLEIYLRPDNNSSHVWRIISGGTNTGYGTGAGGLGFYYQDSGGGNVDYNLILRENQTSRFFGRVDIDHSNIGAEPYSGLIVKNTASSGDMLGGVTVDAANQSHYRYMLGGTLKWQTRVGSGNGTDDFRLYSWTTASDILVAKPTGEGQFRFFKNNGTEYGDSGTATGSLTISGYGGQGGTANPSITMSANMGGWAMFYMNRIYNGSTIAYNDSNARYFDFYRDGSSKMRMVMDSDDDFGFYHVDDDTTFNVWTTGGTNALRVEDSGGTTLASLNVTGAATVSSNNIFHAGYNNTWAQIPAGTRTNYELSFKPASGNFAGVQFIKQDASGGGYLLIRADTDADPTYKANGITLVGDGGWLSLVQRTTSNTGIRLLTGQTPVERLTISSAGVIDAPSATWNRTYHQEDPASGGFNRDVHTHWGVLCAGSNDGAPTTFTVIETNIDQDSYRMGGFTILIMDNYGSDASNSGAAARTRARIDLAGYWNPESNGGFMGWNYTTTNPRERPTIYVMRNSSTGKVAFAYQHSPVTTASYPIIVACDLWIGYSGASEADGKNWSIHQKANLNEYQNSDQVNYVGGNGNYQNSDGSFVISKSSGTMFSHGSVGDAIGYNTAYGTYIAGSGNRYVYSGAQSTHPVFYDGSSANNILHNGGQIANTYNGDHTFTTTTTSAGIKVSNDQTGGPAIKIHSTNTNGTDWWLISNSSSNADGAGRLQLWANNYSFTAATFGNTNLIPTNFYTPTYIQVSNSAPTFTTHTTGNTSPGLLANANGQNAHALVVNQPNTGYWSQIISAQKYGLYVDNHVADGGGFLYRGDVAGTSNFEVRGNGIVFHRTTTLHGVQGTVMGNATHYADSQNGANIDYYAPNGAYAHMDSRNNGNHAMLHKYTYVGTHGYGAYREAWWDSSSYHEIGAISDAIRTNGDFVASGNITAYGTYSDIRLKENVRPFENARELIKDIGVHRFNYIGKDDDLIGVIAQEVEQTLPQLVYELIDTDSDEVRKAVRYDHLSAVLLKVVKEQEEEINELKAMMQKILEKIDD